MTLDPEIDPADLEGGIIVARCPKIHTLGVDLVNGVSPSTDFSWFLQMVSSAPLRKLQMKVPNLTTEGVEYIPWVHIHRVIVEGSETQGMALSGFRVVLDLPVTRDPPQVVPLEVITEIVESKMPRLRKNIEFRYR